MSNRPKLGAHSIPGDLVLIGLLGVWTVIVGFDLLSMPIGQIGLGMLAILFAPGYALGAVLFPKSGSESGEDGPADATRGFSSRVADGSPTAVERVVLAVGLSVSLVPLLGIVLSSTPWGITARSLLGTVGVITGALVIIAAARRRRVKPQDRFEPQIAGSVRHAAESVHGTISDQGTNEVMPTPGASSGPGIGSGLTLLLIGGVIVAASGVGFAAMTTDRSGQFTEFSLLTQDDETGNLVAGDYPGEIPIGETETVYVRLTNQEEATTRYTIVVLLQSVGANGEVERAKTLDTFKLRVQRDETLTRQHAIKPTASGDDLRVTYLLYRGSAPKDVIPTTETAYRSVHIWIEVPSDAS
jgi:uncharacterized membrane protein